MPLTTYVANLLTTSPHKLSDLRVEAPRAGMIVGSFALVGSAPLIAFGLVVIAGAGVAAYGIREHYRSGRRA